MILLYIITKYYHNGYGAFFAGCEDCWQMKADIGHKDENI